MKTLPTMLSAAIAAACLSACASRPAPEATAPPAAAGTHLTISGDALFAFGKSGIEDLSGSGREQLDDLAARLHAGGFTLLRIVGHSDRIGSDAANMALSTRRAEAVRDYLLQKGLPDAKMVATGRGAYQPVVECGNEQGQALIDCLAPNRRVDITVDGAPAP